MRLRRGEHPLDRVEAADRRHLHEHGNFQARSSKRREALIDMRTLDEEIAAVLGVGAAHVEHQIVGVRRKHPRGRDVFLDDLFGTERRRALAAIGDGDVDAERHRQLQSLDPLFHRSRAVIRHAVMHHDGAVLRQAPQPRLRVAVRRVDGDRADLDAAEAERRQRLDAQGALVVACRKPDRMRKADARDRAFKPRIGHREQRLHAFAAHATLPPSLIAR